MQFSASMRKLMTYYRNTIINLKLMKNQAAFINFYLVKHKNCIKTSLYTHK